MDAPFASWSPRAEGSRTAAVALAAMVLFAAVWAVLHYGFYADNRIVDTPVYQRYGDAMLDGQVPYETSRSSTRLLRCPSSRCRR